MRKIQNLYVYPVKGCKAIEFTSASIRQQGFVYDRAWMIVREDTGKFITQRQIAKLALIETALPDDVFSSSFDETAPSSVLTLNAPGMPAPVSIPLAGPASPLKLLSVSCWGWKGQAADEGEEVANWLSKYLDVKCRLVKYVGAAVSAENTRFANDFATGFEISFSDQYPVLMTTQADIDDLNSRIGLSEVLPINRFRPNIVLSGCTPWEEDGWREVTFGSGSEKALGATLVKPCERCKVPTIDQVTAEEGEEPLKTLYTFRSGTTLGWSKQKKSWTHSVFFGWMLVFQDEGLLHVGDTLDITKLREDDTFPGLQATST